MHRTKIRWTMAGLLAAVVLLSLASAVPLPAASADPAADPCATVRDEVNRRTVLLDTAQAAGGLTSAQRDQINRERAINAAALRRCNATPSPSSVSPRPSITPSIPASPTPTATPTTTPSPTPTPSPTEPAAGCPAYPAMPDENCTGWRHTGVTLHDCGTDVHLETPDTVYDSCLFHGTVRIQAAGITIRRSMVIGVIARHDSMNGDCKGLLVEDTEVTLTDQVTAPNDMAPIGDCDNMTIRRVYAHHSSTGIGGGDGVLIEDSFTTAMTWGPGVHQAGVGFSTGHHSIIRHNNIECYRWNTTSPGFEQGCSSALSIYTEGSAPNDMLVTQNLFNTAGGYCTYAAGPTGTNIRYLSNRFGRKFHPDCGIFGYATAWPATNPGNVWDGNVWDDTGLPVPAPN